MRERHKGTPGSGTIGIVVAALVLAAVLPAATGSGEAAQAGAESSFAGAAYRVAALAPASVGLNVSSAMTGQPLLASGTVPDPALSYTLCLVPNGTFPLDALTPTPVPTATTTPIPSTTPTSTPTSTPTNTPTNTPTSTPTNTPLPPVSVPTAVPASSGSGSGHAVPSPSGHASVYSGACVVQKPLPGGTESFADVPLGPAPAPGDYDLLLLGPGGLVFAAENASAAPGLVVSGPADVPASGRTGLFGLAFILAAAAWVLLRQFR